MVFTTPVLSNSVHRLLVKATDAAGNTGQSSGFAIIGSSGNDVLSGGPGNDFLTSGAGKDTFVFSGNYGKDTITDFDVTNDTIQFDKSIFQFTSAIAAHTSDSAAGAVINDARAIP
jgi:Ca2+-binding RTX toxin-like protein